MITLKLDDDLEALLNSMADRTHTKPEQLVKDLIKRRAETIAATKNDFFRLCGYLARSRYRPGNSTFGCMARAAQMILCDTNILIEFYKANAPVI